MLGEILDRIEDEAAWLYDPERKTIINARGNVVDAPLRDLVAWQKTAAAYSRIVRVMRGREPL